MVKKYPINIRIDREILCNLDLLLDILNKEVSYNFKPKYTKIEIIETALKEGLLEILQENYIYFNDEDYFNYIKYR